MSRAAARTGFTLFQLLVVLAILAILLGLLLPLISVARERAAMIRSQNNLRQIAIGCHAYNDVNAVLPPGVDDKGFSVAARILPYLEQQAVYNKIDFKKSVDDKANKDARGEQIPVFLADLDPVKSVTTDWGATNYLFCAGTKYGLKDNDGVFYLNSKIALQTIPDGTSNTIMAAETLKGDNGMKATDVRRQHVSLKKEALKDLTDKSGVSDWEDNKNIKADRCASWMDGRFLQGTFTASRKLNDPKPDVDCGGTGGLSGPRSLQGFVNTAMCDGSVRAVKVTVSMQTWQAAATQSGGEVLGNDF